MQRQTIGGVAQKPGSVGLEAFETQLPRIMAGGCGCVVSSLPARGEIWWCELPEAGLPVGTLVDRLGRLSDERMREICGAIAVALAC